MAIITKVMGGDGDPERGYVKFEVDYDNVALRLTTLRCINDSTEDCWGKVVKLSNGRTYEHVFPALTTQEFAIPTNTAQRLTITVDERGRIDGVDYFFMWPAP
jgi:hypothetical protein